MGHYDEPEPGLRACAKEVSFWLLLILLALVSWYAWATRPEAVEVGKATQEHTMQPTGQRKAVEER